MAKLKVFLAAMAVVGTMASANLAKAATAKCGFNGDYSFFFWDPEAPVSGVGFVGVKLDPKTKCRSGIVLPGGILNCNIFDGGIYEDFIEDGSVFLESDGEGTMEIETNSSRGICGLGVNALELDISVVLGGKSVLFNSDGEEFAGSGLIPQAGYVATFTGRADKCFAGQISGCYDARFWTSDIPLVGDCTICVNGAGAVTGGSCRCHTGAEFVLNESVPSGASFEYLSEIEAGGYTLGENCQSSTGYLWFVTSSDEICGLSSFMALDFGVAQQGKEIIGACDTSPFILNNSSELNAGIVSCAFEGWLQ